MEIFRFDLCSVTGVGGQESVSVALLDKGSTYSTMGGVEEGGFTKRVTAVEVAVEKLSILISR
jgi:hypothetical protein